MGLVDKGTIKGLANRQGRTRTENDDFQQRPLSVASHPGRSVSLFAGLLQKLPIRVLPAMCRCQTTKQRTTNCVCPGCPIARLSPFTSRVFSTPLLFAKALMINQWELANARSYGSSPVHAREDILMTSSAMPSMQSGLLRSTVGFLVLFSLASSTISAVNTAPPDAAYVDTVNKTDVYLQELADARVVSGTVAVQKSGQLVYSNAFGFASEVS